MIIMENASAPAAPVTHTKQYVFVDEYNRHKRLKVMRACDGCRKRKIRCDGALQNGPWPCGACQRLKLKCVPPSLDQDNDSGSDTAEAAPPTQTQFLFQNTTFSSHGRVAPSPSQTNYSWTGSSATPLTATTAATSATSALSQHEDSTYYVNPPPFNPLHQQLTNQLDSTYDDDESHPAPAGSSYLRGPAHAVVPGLVRAETVASDGTRDDPEEVDSAARELTEQMGDMAIEVSSVLPFVADHQKNLPEHPSIDEVVLPPDVIADPILRIPPKMMPHDGRAEDYFQYFFEYIHPYVPVLNKPSFLRQWRTSRDNISPLLLTSIFACVSVYLEEPKEVKMWLALAIKHEESFKDVPRLSTIQALVLLMKAREFSPTQGYYYKSWMALKYMITMAMDLGLDEHRQLHKGGDVSCKLTPGECLMRTRIWQTLFTLELFIGAPQGRSDYSVDETTVDLGLPFPSADLDAFEYQTSRKYAVMAQCVGLIKQTNKVFQNFRRTATLWALDPSLARQDADLVTFLRDLPPDMQIHYPEDGSAPWLGGGHYVAGLHAYFHLCVIMHHRPQLQAKLEKRDSTFKVHLDVCAQSAAMICKVQEALIRDFGVHGLLFMLRGINFTVYCVLTCAMLHLVSGCAATSVSAARRIADRPLS